MEFRRMLFRSHILKCRALGDIVMSPAKAKDRFALVAVMNPPEIVEAAFLQWITFKIEEQIGGVRRRKRSEEHTSELQSLMRNSYAVFCLKKKNKKPDHTAKT